MDRVGFSPKERTRKLIISHSAGLFCGGRMALSTFPNSRTKLKVLEQPASSPARRGRVHQSPRRGSAVRVRLGLGGDSLCDVGSLYPMSSRLESWKSQGFKQRVTETFCGNAKRLCHVVFEWHQCSAIRSSGGRSCTARCSPREPILR